MMDRCVDPGVYNGRLCCHQPEWRAASCCYALGTAWAGRSWKVCTRTACFSSARKNVSKIFDGARILLAVIGVVGFCRDGGRRFGEAASVSGSEQSPVD